MQHDELVAKKKSVNLDELPCCPLCEKGSQHNVNFEKAHLWEHDVIKTKADHMVSGVFTTCVTLNAI